MSAPIDPDLIAPPDAGRPPLKVNVFSATRSTNTSLMPMFPTYLDRGCIVPTLSAFRGGEGRKFGAFEHFNTVDEVNICFGSNGTRRKAGQVAVGPRRHAVGGVLADPSDPDSYYISTVTQRQLEEGAQTEIVAFRCAKCQAELVAHEFEEKFEATAGSMPAAHGKPLGTTIDSSRAVDLQEEKLVCAACGHRNEPFPVEMWGWRRYVDKTDTAELAWKSYAAAIDETETA